MHKHGMTQDTDTREVWAINPDSSSGRASGRESTDHCRQSSHQGLGVLLQRRTYRLRGQRPTAI
jgi:hypothetical protein